MRVFTGHQLSSPLEAFFVFARSKQAAIDYLAAEDIEVDERSLQQVRDPGAVLFRARGRAFFGEAEEVRFDGELPDWSDEA